MHRQMRPYRKKWIHCAIPIIHPQAMKARFRQHLRNSFPLLIMTQGLAKYADSLALEGNFERSSLSFLRFNRNCTVVPLNNA